MRLSKLDVDTMWHDIIDMFNAEGLATKVSLLSNLALALKKPWPIIERRESGQIVAVEVRK